MRTQGFTLIEMLSVIVILSLLSLIGAQMITNTFRSYFHSQAMQDMNEQAQLAFTRLSRDIRALHTVSIMTTSQLQFTNSENKTLNYQLTGSTLTLNNQPLAEHISQLTFTYLDAGGKITTVPANVYYVTTQLTFAENNATLSGQTTVQRRRRKEL